MAKKYSASERKAFHMGRAFAVGRDGGQVVCPDEKTKKSFRNGVNEVRGKKAGGIKKSGKKSTSNGSTKSGYCVTSPVSDGYIVDVHGNVVKAIVDGK